MREAHMIVNNDVCLPWLYCVLVGLRWIPAYAGMMGRGVVRYALCWFTLDSRLRGNDGGGAGMTGMTVPPLRDSMQTM